MAGGAPEPGLPGGDGEEDAGRRGEERRGVAKQRTEPCVLIQVRSMWCSLIAPPLRLPRGPWAVGLWAALRMTDAGKDARALASASAYPKGVGAWP